MVGVEANSVQSKWDNYFLFVYNTHIMYIHQNLTVYISNFSLLLAGSVVDNAAVNIDKMVGTFDDLGPRTMKNA